MQVVTPDGFPPGLWGTVIHQAPRMTLRNLAPSGGGHLVVLGAHPDDETIGAGRLIAHWARTIGPVTIVSMSAGEACLDHLGVQVPQLGQIRRRELAAAGQSLGAQRTLCCSIPDGKIDAGLPAVRRQFDRLVGAAAMVAAPWRFDPHPDHAALGTAAARSCAQLSTPMLEYSIWSSFWQRPSILEDTGYEVVTVATDQDDDVARDRALAGYRSQREPVRADLTPVVPASMLAHHDRQFLLRPKEYRR